MRIQIRLTLRVLSAFAGVSVLLSSPATHAATKKLPRTLPKASQSSGTDRARETALKKVGVATFISSDGSVKPETLTFLRDRLTSDLNSMSYLEATNSDEVSGNDGLITADVTAKKVFGSIQSRTGVSLAKFNAVQTPSIDVSTPAKISELSKALIDQVLRAMPYRAFVTKKLDYDVFELNIGTRHGVLTGQRFRVFDFAGMSFESAKRDLGEVQVIEAREDTSTIELLSGTMAALYGKVGFPENARGMVTSTQVETRGYAFIGAALLSASPAGDPQLLDRGYSFSSTPGFLLGGGWGRFGSRLLIAQAKSTDVDLVYIEGIANYEMHETTFGGLNKFSWNLGARLQRVGISTKASVTTTLESTTSLSPEAEARLERVLRGPVRAFVQLEAYYPIFVSGMTTSSLFFSFGVGGSAGLTLDLSQRLFIDAGARYRTIRRPVVDQSSLQESFTELFGDFGARF